MPDEIKPGPTGEFPDGKINSEDQGVLMIALKTDGARVVIDFGAPVKWFALSPEQAVTFANGMKACAEAITLAKSSITN